MTPSDGQVSSQNDLAFEELSKHLTSTATVTATLSRVSKDLC